MKTQLDLAIEIAEEFQKINEKYSDPGTAKAFALIADLLIEYRNFERKQEVYDHA